MTEIKTTANKKYKHFKSLKLKKNRYLSSEYTVEGIKSAHDALMSNREISAVIISEDFCDSGILGLAKNRAEVYTVARELFPGLCDTQTPQGIMAVLKMEERGEFVPTPGQAYVFCDGINDPGNLGTIIRTADAAGFGGVIVSEGSADIYSPKTVRASMGSFFGIELITGKSAADLRAYKESGFAVIGGALGENTVDYRDADYKKSAVIVVGNEANGISPEVMRLCRCVKIPIFGNAESLNVSVAAGILMYEWARKNKKNT